MGEWGGGKGAAAGPPAAARLHASSTARAPRDPAQPAAPRPHKHVHAVIMRSLVALAALGAAAHAAASPVMLEVPPTRHAAAKVRAANVIPASDPRLWYQGRDEINADGTRSFDWESWAVFANLQGASYLQVRGVPAPRAPQHLVLASPYRPQRAGRRRPQHVALVRTSATVPEYRHHPPPHHPNPPTQPPPSLPARW